MPIEIKELIVKARVGDKEEEQDLNKVYQKLENGKGSPELTPAIKRELVSTIVEEVIKKLNGQKSY